MRPPAAQERQGELGQRERREHVDRVDLLEHVERVVGERRLGARAEQARVVDQQVECGAGGRDERRAVSGVGDVAGEGDDLGQLRSSARARSSAAAPRASITSRQPARGERACERESKAA